jgi:hypothetical protein
VSLSSFFRSFRGVRRPSRVTLPLAPPDVQDPASPIATLQALLAAYGIRYDAVQLERECGVSDGLASIDEVERVALRYGVPAKQTIVPAEHVVLRGAQLPVIALQGTADGYKSFLLVWRIEGEEVQVFAGSDGFFWEPCAEAEARLLRHEMDLPAQALHASLKESFFLSPLTERMRRLGVGLDERARLLAEAQREPTWRGVAALDAAVRHIAVKRVANPSAAVRAAAATALSEVGAPKRIPAEAFWVREAPRGVAGEERVTVRGTVIIEAFSS